MWFCPFDGTLLQIQTLSPSESDAMANFNEEGPSSLMECKTCPYTHSLKCHFIKTTRPERKEVDDILGGAAAWENVDRTQANCSKCSHNEAFFMQMQIRSADEPMSVFYKCCKCGFQWNDK
jgi:DNA-directed RNA polymerase III subunit RPC11